MVSNIVVQQCHLYIGKILCLDGLSSIQWMNKKAPAREAYHPTGVEHVANILTHGVAIIPSILATAELLHRSQDATQTVASLVYGLTLVFLFSISTCFHCVFFCKGHGYAKNVLHRCDRAMIYVFIAGSYFPWLTVKHVPLSEWSASSMKWYVWLLAILGIVYQQSFHERYKRLETILYILMGIGPALPIISEHDFSGLTELKIGGVLYILGIVFFKSDGTVPCAHAIWHLFVASAATVHYYAILNHLYPNTVL